MSGKSARSADARTERVDLVEVKKLAGAHGDASAAPGAEVLLQDLGYQFEIAHDHRSRQIWSLWRLGSSEARRSRERAVGLHRGDIIGRLESWHRDTAGRPPSGAGGEFIASFARAPRALVLDPDHHRNPRRPEHRPVRLAALGRALERARPQGRPEPPCGPPARRRERASPHLRTPRRPRTHRPGETRTRDQPRRLTTQGACAELADLEAAGARRIDSAAPATPPAMNASRPTRSSHVLRHGTSSSVGRRIHRPGSTSRAEGSRPDSFETPQTGIPRRIARAGR